MNQPTEGFDLIQTLKLTLLISVPLGILLGLIYYFRVRSDQMTSGKIMDVEILKEEMARIAEEKKAYRIEQAELENKPKLDKEEIQKEFEKERGEFDEFELIEPLKDLTEEEESVN